MRAWVKVSAKCWKPRAHVEWERVNGVVPRGMVVHHENRDTLDDYIENLRLITRAEHVSEHRRELNKRRRSATVVT
jgi:hypothetical protein